ncbi:hypothetical protein EVAR_56585_1 [Eumeta japonica]|uniref:Uncharacterized protein n=1 Tax=Eumeta variegata TaxID=151549 RepID=A0A4C1Z2W4_EUMVA|nr:hypothetical protein EVAR_56585_1 [Eumeta japonica]
MYVQRNGKRKLAGSSACRMREADGDALAGLGLEPPRSLRYGRESVFRTHVAPTRKECKMHGHAFPIKMYATQCASGCTTYKMLLDWCIRRSCTPTATHETRLK